MKCNILHLSTWSNIWLSVHCKICCHRKLLKQTVVNGKLLHNNYIQMLLLFPNDIVYFDQVNAFTWYDTDKFGCPVYWSIFFLRVTSLSSFCAIIIQNLVKKGQGRHKFEEFRNKITCPKVLGDRQIISVVLKN